MVPPMIFSFLLLFSLPTIILLIDSDARKLLLLNILKCASKKKKHTILDNDEIVNNCIFVSAKLLDNNNNMTPIITFEQAQSYIELGRTLELVYRHNDFDHKIVYNPCRRILPGKNVVLCPPYDPSWTALSEEELNMKVILGTLFLHKRDGSNITIDVSEELHKLLGPLGDFHEMAGATLGVYSFIEDVPDDTISASLIYYDGEGNEHSLILPYESTFKNDYAPVEPLSETNDIKTDNKPSPGIAHCRLKRSKSVIPAKTRLPHKLLKRFSMPILRKKNRNRNSCKLS